MILQRLLNYGSTWATGMVVTKVLLGVGVLGVIWSLFLFAQKYFLQSLNITSGLKG